MVTTSAYRNGIPLISFVSLQLPFPLSFIFPPSRTYPSTNICSRIRNSDWSPSSIELVVRRAVGYQQNGALGGFPIWKSSNHYHRKWYYLNLLSLSHTHLPTVFIYPRDLLSRYLITCVGCDVPNETNIPLPDVLHDQFRIDYYSQCILMINNIKRHKQENLHNISVDF